MHHCLCLLLGLFRYPLLLSWLLLLGTFLEGSSWVINLTRIGLNGIHKRTSIAFSHDVLLSITLLRWLCIPCDWMWSSYALSKLINIIDGILSRLQIHDYWPFFLKHFLLTICDATFLLGLNHSPYLLLLSWNVVLCFGVGTQMGYWVALSKILLKRTDTTIRYMLRYYLLK